ncbi:hypothetical protein ACNHKD_11120 [Methylocystis sp. JAN1]|uniref:hypothetical protein n=1 Tax=Methylocystis sp. JAN1 TaxID=3397211 RepID=UPI003FA229F5
MAAAGKVSSSFAMIAAAGLAGALCVAATPILSQDAQRPAARTPAAPKTKPQKDDAEQKPSSRTGVKPAAPAPTATKQNVPAKAPAQQPAPRAAPVEPTPPTQTRLAPLPPVDTSSPPPSLPRASRDRMRSCAEAWEKMKRASNANLPMWRDFATGCLTR